MAPGLPVRTTKPCRRCTAWVIAALALASCGREPTPPSQPAQPEAAVPVNPCSQWLDFVCGRVAEQDSLCLAVQESVGLFTSQTCASALEHKAFTDEQLTQRAKQCSVLADKVCADLPGMTRFCKMFRGAVVRYTPDYCVGMLRKYPETLAQLTKQATAARLPPGQAAALLAGDPPAFGPDSGRIQMVEFVDYESRYSGQTAAIVRNLAAKYASELHFVIRQFPLPDNAHAYLAAQAALAANAQGKYWQLHDKLLEHRQQLDRASLVEYAREIGLDVASFKAALDQKRYAAAVDADLELGKRLKVVGMPTLYVNGERLLNSVDEAGIVDAIEEYLAAATASTTSTAPGR